MTASKRCQGSSAASSRHRVVGAAGGRDRPARPL